MQIWYVAELYVGYTIKALAINESVCENTRNLLSEGEPQAPEKTKDAEKTAHSNFYRFKTMTEVQVFEPPKFVEVYLHYVG